MGERGDHVDGFASEYVAMADSLTHASSTLGDAEAATLPCAALTAWRALVVEGFIKDTKANTPLFEQIATLASQSLHRIKEFGLLTPGFLSALPNPQDQVPPRYEGIRTAIVEEMKTQPLTPTHARGHAPASRLVQARASL